LDSYTYLILAATFKPSHDRAQCHWQFLVGKSPSIQTSISMRSGFRFTKPGGEFSNGTLGVYTPALTAALEK
jgi:hypothetical protein